MHSPTTTRLQVGPTGWAYLCILLATSAAAFYTQANLMFLALGLLLGALIVSLLWVWLSLRFVTLQREPPDHGVAGEALVIHYTVAKRSRLPAFSLVLTEATQRGRSKHQHNRQQPAQLAEPPTGWIAHLGPRQTLQAQTHAWPRRRGDLNLTRVKLHSDFPFGLVRRVLVFDLPAGVLILPELHRMTRQVMSRITRLDTARYHQLDKEGGADEFFALRDYRKGDALKVIHWKHSAKVGKLVSRELTQPVPPSLMIELDLSAYAAPHGETTAPPLTAQGQQRIDRAINLTASLVCDAYQAGYRIGLTVKGAETPPLSAHHALPHRTHLLETLARLEPGSASPTTLHPSEPPAVIIQPDRSMARGYRAGRRAVLLSGEDLEHLCVPMDSERLLTPGRGLLRRSEQPMRTAQSFKPGSIPAHTSSHAS